DLRRRFEALKARLAAEGLFDAARKRPLPRLPRTLVVITSPTGAAVRDFLGILRRRRWGGTVRLLPVRVQGSEAAPEIAAMLKKANAERLGDVVVVTRGGGSLEDLWPFNEEAVARAVAASEIPVVSAVGHEIDFTLSDFASDVRAETPSGAAELLSSDFVAFAEAVAQHRRRLAELMTATLERRVLHLRALRQTLRAHSPVRLLEQAWMRLDDVAARRHRVLDKRLAAERERLGALRLRLARLAPQERLRWSRQHLAQLQTRLAQASPEAAQRRGYAIVRSSEGRLLTRRADHAPDAPIEVEWIDGKRRFLPGEPLKRQQGELPFED
ncbi:MAG: exodeoxyribonuclease VII large subunit, partial [Verrucomicrobiota bacterium]